MQFANGLDHTEIIVVHREEQQAALWVCSLLTRIKWVSMDYTAVAKSKTDCAVRVGNLQLIRLNHNFLFVTTFSKL